MKAFFLAIYPIFIFTAIITHVWTVIIAFQIGGFLSGIISLLLPFLSELYWMLKMFGDNDLYAYIALIHLVISIPIAMMRNSNN